MSGASDTALGVNGARGKPGGALYHKLRPGPGHSREQVIAHQRARIHGAVIEIVSERGYRALKMEELLRLAGVSSHTFYELFDDKDECFLATYEVVVSHGAQRVIAAQQQQECENWRGRLELVLLELARQVAGERKAARFALVEAFAGGPAALVQMRNTGEVFAALVAEILACAPDAVELPPLVLQGIVAGVERVARASVIAGRAGDLPDRAGELTQWTLRLAGGEVCELDGLPAPPCSPLEQAPSDLSGGGDNRARILAALVCLAAREGYCQLSEARVRAEAGVSCKSFAAHFQSLDECFAAALAQMTERAMQAIVAAATTACDWPRGIYLGLRELCTLLAADAPFAKLAFVEVFAPGAQGVHTREAIMAGVTEQFRLSAPASSRPSQLAAEASTGAVWGIVHEHIATGQAGKLPQQAASLSFLALAPAIGARSAIAAITAEHARMAEVLTEKRAARPTQQSRLGMLAAGAQ